MGTRRQGARRKGFGMSPRMPIPPHAVLWRLWDLWLTPRHRLVGFQRLRGRVRSPRYEAALNAPARCRLYRARCVTPMYDRVLNRLVELAQRLLLVAPVFASSTDSPRERLRVVPPPRPSHSLLAYLLFLEWPPAARWPTTARYACRWPAVPPFDQVAIAHIEDQPGARPFRRIDLACGRRLPDTSRWRSARH